MRWTNFKLPIVFLSAKETCVLRSRASEDWLTTHIETLKIISYLIMLKRYRIAVIRRLSDKWLCKPRLVAI